MIDEVSFSTCMKLLKIKKKKFNQFMPHKMVTYVFVSVSVVCVTTDIREPCKLICC